VRRLKKLPQRLLQMLGARSCVAHQSREWRDTSAVSKEAVVCNVIARRRHAGC
jgi:hypothetical protein